MEPVEELPCTDLTDLSRIAVVCDDFSYNRLAMAETVRQYFGNEVDEVMEFPDGLPALNFLLSQIGSQVRFVISDNNMDQLDGIEVLRILREQGNNVPFVLVSGASGGPIDGKKLRKEQAAVYKEKPLSVDGIAMAIHEAIALCQEKSPALASDEMDEVA